MAIVDKHGLPLSVSTHAANHHEVNLVQRSFVFCMIEATPDKPIGGCACDGDLLEKEIAQQDIEMIAPHRKSRTGKIEWRKRPRTDASFDVINAAG